MPDTKEDTQAPEAHQNGEEGKKPDTNGSASEKGTQEATKATMLAHGYHHHVVPTDKSGALNIYVQGDIEEAHKDKDGKCVFMTCHDIGNNHASFKVSTSL